MQFVFTEEGIWEIDRDKWEEWTFYQWMWATIDDTVYGFDLIKNPTGLL